MKCQDQFSLEKKKKNGCHLLDALRVKGFHFIFHANCLLIPHLPKYSDTSTHYHTCSKI